MSQNGDRAGPAPLVLLATSMLMLLAASHCRYGPLAASGPASSPAPPVGRTCPRACLRSLPPQRPVHPSSTAYPTPTSALLLLAAAAAATPRSPTTTARSAAATHAQNLVEMVQHADGGTVSVKYGDKEVTLGIDLTVEEVGRQGGLRRRRRWDYGRDFVEGGRYVWLAPDGDQIRYPARGVRCAMFCAVALPAGRTGRLAFACRGLTKGGVGNGRRVGGAVWM